LNTDEYIESGKIEMCLMGAASGEDVQELTELRGEVEEINTEALQTETLLEDLALSHRHDPLPWLKNRLFGQINWGNPFFF
jgi:hypothetical protein